MNETIIRNEQLGITLVKSDLNGVNVVWAEDVRKALKWDTMQHMLYGLKKGKEVIKVLISDLKAEGWNFTKFGGVKRNSIYAYFLTRQGVSRLIATRRPHDVKDDPDLADWLDRLQDWIYGDVLPEVLATGQYTGKPLEAGKHAINGIPQSMSEALRMLADEYDSHSLTINALDEAVKTKAQVSRDREGTMFSQLGVMTRQVSDLKRELAEANLRADMYQSDSIQIRTWRSNMSKGQQRRWHGDPKNEDADKKDKEPTQPYLFDDNGNPT